MAEVERLSFASGEVSPLLRARSDLARQQAGVQRLENMAVLVEGGVTRCPGTRYVAPLKAESEPGRKLRFIFSSTDAYVLDFNGGALRFFKNGGQVLDGMGAPYEITSPYAAADLPNLRPAKLGNLMWLACKGYQPRVLTRRGDADWTLATYDTTSGPVDTQNLDVNVTIQATGTDGPVTLTASTLLFTPAMIGATFRLDEPDLSSVPLWTANDTVAIGDQRRNGGRVYRVVSGTNTGDNPPVHETGTVASGNGKTVWEYLHSGYGFARITAVAGATATDATAIVTSRLPDSVMGGTYRWWPPAWTAEAGWPDLVALDGLRLAWLRDDKMWETLAGDFDDFAFTAADDSAIAIRLPSPDGRLPEARWALKLGMLTIGTASMEFSFRGAAAFEPITAANAQPVVEAQEGAAAAPVEMAEAGALFFGKGGRRLHLASYDPAASEGGIKVDEVSLAARHLLKAGGRNIAWQRDPNRIAWTVTAGGELRGLTLMPKEGVLGWFRRPTINGAIEDVCVIPAIDESADEVWLTVRRTIGGATRRFTELMQPFFEPLDEDAPTAEGAWFVDCGLSYSGSPEDTFDGLDHLEGEEVRVFADGVDRGLFTVAGGAVTLPGEVAAAVIGLPQTWRVKTLPIEYPSASGSIKGKAKAAATVRLEITEAFGGAVAGNGYDAFPIFDPPGYEPGPQPLTAGLVEAATLSPTEPEAILDLTGDDAWPFTLSGITASIDVTEG